jgi:hypothetical protein
MKLVYDSNSLNKEKGKPMMNEIKDLLLKIEQLTRRVKQLEVDLAWSQKQSHIN